MNDTGAMSMKAAGTRAVWRGYILTIEDDSGSPSTAWHVADIRNVSLASAKNISHSAGPISGACLVWFNARGSNVQSNSGQVPSVETDAGTTLLCSSYEDAQAVLRQWRKKRTRYDFITAIAPAVLAVISAIVAMGSLAWALYSGLAYIGGAK